MQEEYIEGEGYERYPLPEYYALDMAIKALEQPTSDDCVSRQAVFETIDDCNSDGLKGIFCSYDDGERFKEYIKKLPPVTPTHCIATVRFSKDDLRDICNERIEIKCTHGTCKDCKHFYLEQSGDNFIPPLYRCVKYVMAFKGKTDFYCADFEKRGDKE